ncbi:MAG: serine protease [Thermomicrobiales bacterium]
MRTKRSVLEFLLCLLLVAGCFPSRAAAAQIDREVRDRVVPAAVEVAAAARWEENDFSFTFPIPLGSGTIVSPEGLILTNHHVVTGDELNEVIASWTREMAEQYPGVKISLLPKQFIILTSDGVNEPLESWIAEVVADDARLDLAVLKIVADSTGDAGAIAGQQFPFIALGDSGLLGLGDRVHVFAYPSIGGGALTYTPGVVSGFQRQEGVSGVAWITTDAVTSGGSSGGTAVNEAGELVGIPTQGSELDCRPGDTNRDGEVDVNDIGCIPTGGSLGQLRPVNQALPLIAEASNASPATVAVVTPEPTVATESTASTTLDGAVVDLPRLALDPAAVSAAGMPGFEVDFSRMTDARGAAYILAIDPKWEDRLTQANLVRMYVETLAEEEPGTGPATRVITTLSEYASAQDAVAGFDLVEREIEDTYDVVDHQLDPIAEESELSSWTYVSTDTGETIAAFEVTMRQGALIAAVRVSGPEAESSAVRQRAVALASVLEQRLQQAEPGGLPLSDRVLRVTDNGVNGPADLYRMIDGVVTPTLWFDDELWGSYWSDLGVTNVYDAVVFLPYESDPSPGRVSARVYEFGSAADATRYLATYENDLGDVTSLRTLELGQTYGDESAAYAYESDWSDEFDPEYRTSIVIRDGAMVAELEILAVQPAPDDVIQQLAAAQAVCLRDGCPANLLDAPAWFMTLPAPAGGANPGESSGASAPTRQPEPTAVTAPPKLVPVFPTPTPAPVVAEPGAAWGLYEDFEDPSVLDRSQSDTSIKEIVNGAFRVSILTSGWTDGIALDFLPTEGRDVQVLADVRGVTGNGDILVSLIGDGGATEWQFAVDPGAMQWSLYRDSTSDNGLFYWVEPRPLPASIGATVRQVELQVRNGQPVLLVNGVNVVTPTGVTLPAMPGSLTVGIGAGVNPDVYPAGTITVDFESFTVQELP